MLCLVVHLLLVAKTGKQFLSKLLYLIENSPNRFRHFLLLINFSVTAFPFIGNLHPVRLEIIFGSLHSYRLCKT